MALLRHVGTKRTLRFNGLSQSTIRGHLPGPHEGVRRRAAFGSTRSRIRENGVRGFRARSSPVVSRQIPARSTITLSLWPAYAAATRAPRAGLSVVRLPMGDAFTRLKISAPPHRPHDRIVKCSAIQVLLDRRGLHQRATERAVVRAVLSEYQPPGGTLLNTLGVRLDDATFARLVAAATSQRRTLSDHVRLWLEECESEHPGV